MQPVHNLVVLVEQAFFLGLAPVMTSFSWIINEICGGFKSHGWKIAIELKSSGKVSNDQTKWFVMNFKSVDVIIMNNWWDWSLTDGYYVGPYILARTFCGQLVLQ